MKSPTSARLPGEKMARRRTLEEMAKDVGSGARGLGS